MEKRLMRQQLLGALFVLVTGTALHFVYGWSGGHPVAGALSAVNESVWEHMKLVFVPLFFLTLGEVFFLGRQWPNFLVSRAISTLVGTALVPVLYYTYTGILGVSADWFNITIFFLAAGAAFCLETKLFQSEFSCPFPSGLAFVLICLVAVIFTVLTFAPPQIPFFQDPITGTYGFQKPR